MPIAIEQLRDHDDFFSIPDLSIGRTENVSTPSQSNKTGQESPIAQLETGNNSDIWLLPYENPVNLASYQSWDSFEEKTLGEGNTPYITETGPAVFDTVLAAEGDLLNLGNTDHILVDANVYAASVLALGLGRSSVFFTWDKDQMCFSAVLPRTSISGYTKEALDGLLVIFLTCGSMTRCLQIFVDDTYTINASPGRIALADAVSTLLITIRSRLSVSGSLSRSFLQLQALFQPVHSVLTCFQRIITNISASRSDEFMLSTIFKEIQSLEHRSNSLRDFLVEALTHTSQPWFEFAGEWLGLQKEAGLPLTKEGKGKGFVKIEKKEWTDEQGLDFATPDYVLDYDKVPLFIQPEDARAMFEAGRGLRFLKDHHADHPLTRAGVVASAHPPLLAWASSWVSIVQIERKALQYEKDLTTALQAYSRTSSSFKSPIKDLPEPLNLRQDFFDKPEEDMEAYVLASIKTLDMPLADTVSPDRLSLCLSKYLASEGELASDESIFAPPISLLPVLSFNPIIMAQARIINGTCMRVFFHSHQLREHLSLQRNFHLLGNGVFSSRLSHSLFDPELESAERRRGVARSGGVMGLRLGGRDTWPPASSELRLALMGVLTESYFSKNSLTKYHSGTFLGQTSLPGDLSFAVRDMSEEEIQACLNPDSLEALDFLRLSYKPPEPLGAIFTPMILFKYDQLFKLLLRVTRMLYVVSALFREATDRTSYWQGIDRVAQRFRIEAHHFISSVCGYFFDNGVESTWRVFERKLDQIEERINNDDDNITLGQHEGLDRLRDYHERVLDRIMFALLLRKRQQPVMRLLEEIFTLILQFSKHSRERALGAKRKIGEDSEVREMYMRFRKKVGVFITVCRGLSEKKGYGEKRILDTGKAKQQGMFDGNDLAEENTILQLLSRLEMSNYYSKDGKG